jgi:hypothetical protein
MNDISPLNPQFKAILTRVTNDSRIIAVILFAVGISITFAVDIGHRVNSNLLTIPVMNNSAEARSVITHADAAINMTDYIYFAFFISFFIAIIIFGWLVGGLPILAPIYFFIIVLFTFVSVVLQMVWIDIATNPQVIAATVNLPITNFILAHLGLFMAVFGLIGIAVMFAKPNSNGGTY